MIKYAIVGNIASGKSVVEKILKNSGCCVIDTDDIAHDLLNGNQEIMDEFAQYDILDNGVISRDKLGKLVFNDDILKKKLENILHPQIKLKINDFFKKNEHNNSVFVSIPLLFEAKMESMFDKIIFVYAKDNIRLERLMSRNNYSEEYAKLRINSQQSQDDKIKKSDIVIYNNSDIKNLEIQIKNLIL